jgi:hypothetical protein
MNCAHGDTGKGEIMGRTIRLYRKRKVQNSVVVNNIQQVHVNNI